MPGTDVIPSFTITWLIKYVFLKKQNTKGIRIKKVCPNKLWGSFFE
jgi:hypothetical protein